MAVAALRLFHRSEGHDISKISSGIPRLRLNHGVVVLHGVAFRPAVVQPISPAGARLALHTCPAETAAWERHGGTHTVGHDRDSRCPPSPLPITHLEVGAHWEGLWDFKGEI